MAQFFLRHDVYENKLCVRYLQPKFKKVSTECVSDYRKQLHFYHMRTLFFPITYIKYAYVIPEVNIWLHLDFRQHGP